MSARADTTIAWADGDYLFRLAIGQLRELQDLCGTGPFAVFRRLQEGDWRVEDVRETIRLGLIGGGLAPERALILVKRYVDERPLMENLFTAQAVLIAAVIGVPEDPVGKQPAEGDRTEETASPSPPSTEQAAPSDGQPGMSTNSASGSSLQPSTATIEPRAAKSRPRRPASTSSRHSSSATPIS